MAEPLFLDDPYLKECSVKVTGHTDGGFITDNTIFYANSGGQPGDIGTFETNDSQITVVNTVYSSDRTSIIHCVEEGAALPPIGVEGTLRLDWERRYAHMRMHTALHLLCSLIPHPVTGGSIGANESRLDFDMPENPDKAELSAALMEAVNTDSNITTRWITDQELDANPDLVRTMSVKPPRGSGKIRLVLIGPEGSIDMQPCGGTHVAQTSEIGEIHIGKIEKKGKINRRLRVRFGKMP